MYIKRRFWFVSCLTRRAILSTFIPKEAVKRDKIRELEICSYCLNSRFTLWHILFVHGLHGVLNYPDAASLTYLPVPVVQVFPFVFLTSVEPKWQNMRWQ